MIKILNTVDIEETYSKIIKAIYDKLKGNIILNGKDQEQDKDAHSHNAYSVYFWKY